MHIYRISCNKGSLNVEAETPQKAIEKLYKNNIIHIEPSCKNNASHKVELIDADRSSTKYYNIKICNSALNRKVKSADYIEPMPKKKLREIIKDFEKKGGTIIINEESERFLKSQKSEGSTLNATTILLTRNPGRSAVYEELIHAEQYRQDKNDGTYEKRLLCEIEAQEILIKKKEDYGITDKEDKQTRLALKAYKKEYSKFKHKKS